MTLWAGLATNAFVVSAAPAAPAVQFGAYYFDGWSGRNKAGGDPAQPWAKDAPPPLTKELAEHYADRQPLWGWRADTPDNPLPAPAPKDPVSCQ